MVPRLRGQNELNRLQHVWVVNKRLQTLRDVRDGFVASEPMGSEANIQLVDDRSVFVQVDHVCREI